MNREAERLIYEVLVPGCGFFLQEFGQEFLKQAGLTQFGGVTGTDKEENLKEHFRVLLEKQAAVVVAVKQNRKGVFVYRHQATRETACDCIANQAKLVGLFAILSPNPSDPQPIVADRAELLQRCQGKEPRFAAGKNRNIIDPEKQIAESIYVSYQAFAYVLQGSVGQGQLTPDHHGFEFCLFVQVLRYLAQNRPTLERAGKRQRPGEQGYFEASERDSLVDSARSYGFCNAVAELLPEIGLILVRPRPDPDPPPNFRCDGVHEGKVKLSWDLPRDPEARCDAVRLERCLDGQSDWECLIKSLKRSDHVDDLHRARGQKAIYHLSSCYGGVVSPKYASCEVYVPAEPRLKSAEWLGDHIHLEWEKALGSTGTIVFRLVGQSPRVDSGRPIGPDPPFQRVFSGEERFDDAEFFPPRSVVHYLLVGEYPGPVYSEGTPAKVPIPGPPDPPRGLTAKYVFDERTGQSEIRVTLDPGREVGLDYRVLRYEWRKHVVQESESPVTEKVGEWTWIDRTPEGGRQYVYRAIPLRRGIRGAAVDSAPEAARPGVWSLRKVEAEQSVELLFDRHPQAAVRLIRREGDPPKDERDLDAKTLLKGEAADHYRDSPLVTGRTYHYLFGCRYQLPDGSFLWSEPQRISARPRVKPTPATLMVTREGNEVVCRMSRPRVGDLKLFRMAKAPNIRKGEELGSGKLSGLGTEIEVKDCMAVDRHPDPHEPYYIVFTLWEEEEIAIAGEWKRRSLVPDVSGLRALPVHDGVRLRWEWPARCDDALILLAKGKWPGDPAPRTGPDGVVWDCPDASLRTIDRQTYVENGDSLLLENIDPTSADWHVVVRVVVGDAISSGEGEGSRQRIPRARRTRLEYSVLCRGGEIELQWRTDPPCDAFPFVLVGDDRGLPANIESAKPLFSVGPNSPWPSADSRGVRRLVTRSPYNDHAVYCRLFIPPDEPAHDVVAVHHPKRVLLPLRPERRLHRLVLLVWAIIRAAGAALSWLRGLAPRRIFCPYCFSSFFAWRVLFRDRTGKEGKLAWWRRGLGVFVGWRAAISAALRDPDVDPVCPMLCCKGRNIGVLHPLDSGLFYFPSFHIALLGTILSGKSHWSFSASYRLTPFGISPLDEQTSERLKVTCASVRESRMRLDRTKPASDEDEESGKVDPPLLLLASSLSEEAKCSRWVVGLNDAAGELMQSLDVSKLRRRFFRYVLGAKGLALIIDPLQIDKVRRSLGAALPEDAPGSPVSQHVPADVVLKAFRIRGHKPPIRLPTAVVLTKVDSLRRISPSMDRLWQLPIYHPGRSNLAYDLGLHWEVQFAVREFLGEFDPGLVKLVEENFTDFAYFAVAPMGCGARTVDGSDKFPIFSPWRVEEPILWLFARHGYIPTV